MFKRKKFKQFSRDEAAKKAKEKPKGVGAFLATLNQNENSKSKESEKENVTSSVPEAPAMTSSPLFLVDEFLRCLVILQP